MLPPGQNDAQATASPERGAERWVAGGLIGLAILLALLAVAGRDWRLARDMAAGAVRVPTEAYVRWGLWWGAVVNAVLAVLLAVTARWWAGAGGRASGLGRPALPRITRRDAVWLAVILAAAAAVRVPRMGLSFYNDEAYTFRTHVAGRFRHFEDGTLKWRPVRWLDTLWLNNVGNNQMPASVLMRLSYEGWRKAAGAAVGTVREAAVRAPVLLAGMASLVVLWLFAPRVLGAAGSWWVLALGALHPWHVRYSTEARAYGLMLLAVALVFYFLQRAVEDGRRRWWIGMGLAQFGCVWTFTGSVYFLFVLDALVLARQSGLWLRGKEGWTAVARPVAGWLLGAMLAVQLILPSVPQLLKAMEQQPSLRGVMGFEWWSDAVAGMFFGVRGWDWDPENPNNPAMWSELARHKWVAGAALAMLGSWVAGSAIMVWRGGAGRVVALAGPLALVLSWAVMSRQGKFLHPWYVLYMVPGVVVAAGAGLAGLAGLVGRRALGWVAVVAVTGMALGDWLLAIRVYCGHSKENLRGVVEAARGVSYPGSFLREPKGLYAAMVSDADVYDPRMVVLMAATDLDAVVARARRESLPLMVSVGHVGIGETPQVYRRLRESGEFEPVAVLRGLEEEQFTHHLFRLRAGP